MEQYPFDPHSRIVSALTQWDVRQQRRDKHHNPRFLGIALVALAEVESEMPNATAEAIARQAFEGRCLDFVLTTIA